MTFLVPTTSSKFLRQKIKTNHKSDSNKPPKNLNMIDDTSYHDSLLGDVCTKAVTDIIFINIKSRVLSTPKCAVKIMERPFGRDFTLSFALCVSMDKLNEILRDIEFSLNGDAFCRILQNHEKSKKNSKSPRASLHMNLKV